MVTLPNQTMLAGMAQLTGGNTVLLDAGSYGGFSNYLNQTSTWNGTVWTNVSTSNIDPLGPLPGRVDMAMSYDGTNVMMAFGKSATGLLNDTWTWSGTAWTQATPTVVPPGRFGAKAAYSSGIGTVTLFGGISSTGYLARDQWSWTGSTKVWTQVSPATMPTLRKGHCMAASATSVFVFGGEDGGGTLFNDGWTYNGTTWTQLVMTNTPSVRSYAGMAYDSVNSLYVMFGGKNQYGYLDETWTFNPSTLVWTLVQSNAASPSAPTTTLGPAGKVAPQMCFDTNSGGGGKTLLFGGSSATSNTVGNETFLFSGSTLTWTKIT